MTAPNPAVEIKNGSAAYVAGAGGVDITPLATIIIRLSSQADVDSWLIECVTTDETSVAATVTASLTIDATLKTATFTAPVAGKAYRFRSRVNGGIDRNGVAQTSYETTFCVYTRLNGRRVIAADETTEGDSTFGWIAWHNDMIRSTPSGVASGLWGSGSGGGGGGAQGVDYQFQYYSGGSQLGATGLDYDPTTGRVLMNRGLVVQGTAYVSVGSGAAATGVLRLANGGGLHARRADDSADIQVLRVTSGNNLLIGATGNPGDIYLRTTETKRIFHESDLHEFRRALNAPIAKLSGTGIVLIIATGGAEYLKLGDAFVAVGTGAATSGAVRLANNHGVFGRTSADDNNIALLTLNTSDWVAIGNGARKIQLLSGSGGMDIRGDTILLTSGGGTSRVEISASGIDQKTSVISTQDTYHRPYSHIRNLLTTDAVATGIYYWTIKDEAITNVFAEVGAVPSGAGGGGSYARRLRIWANGGVATAGSLESTWTDEVTGAGFTGISVGSGVVIGHSGMTGFVAVKGTPTGQIRFGVTVTHTETAWQ